MSEEDEARRLEERRAKGEEGLRGAQGALRQHNNNNNNNIKVLQGNIGSRGSNRTKVKPLTFAFSSQCVSEQILKDLANHRETLSSEEQKYCKIPLSSCPSKPLHSTIWRSLREQIGDSWRGGGEGRAWRTSGLRNCSSRECSRGDAGKRGYVHTRVWSRGTLPSCSVLQVWGILLVSPNSTFLIVAKHFFIV